MRFDQPKIFISYAREDSSIVQSLFYFLKDKGFLPWLDTINILPGQNWEDEISKAIDQCDFIIICLSNYSVNKRGVFQVEIKKALEKAREKLPSDIFIIPLRFQECSIPDQVKSIQVLDYFSLNAKNLLLKSLYHGIEQRNTTDESVFLGNPDRYLDNGKLIEDNYFHLKIEIDKDNPLFIRVAREAYFALYRSMIQALRGTNNLSILREPDSLKKIIYQRGNSPLMEIHKLKVPGCELAWKYSTPEPSKESEQSVEPNSITTEEKETSTKRSLISFFDGLAMVQAEIFMGRYVDSKPISISKEETILLEWTHKIIEGEFEKFIPKLYSVSAQDLVLAACLCVSISKNLLFNCGLLLNHELPDLLKERIVEIESKLNFMRNRLA